MKKDISNGPAGGSIMLNKVLDLCCHGILGYNECALMTLVVTQLLFFTRNGFIAPLLFFVSATEIHTLKLPTLFCLFCSFCPRGSVVKFAFLKIVSAQMVTLALKAF